MTPLLKYGHDATFVLVPDRGMVSLKEKGIMISYMNFFKKKLVP